MPDIAVQCPECGAERNVSEYATTDRLQCLICKAKLELPERENPTGGLSIRQNEGPKTIPMHLTDVVDPEVPDASAVAAAASAPKVDVHAGKEDVKASKAWLGYVSFILVAGLLIGFQWKAADFSQFDTAYIWVRNLVALGSYLLVVLIAFQDTTGMGALCLAFPPFTLIYVSSSLESYLLRGVFFASLLAMATEVYFFGSDAAFVAIGGHLENFIQTIDNLIVRASM